MQMKLFVQRLDPRAPLPAYQTPGSAAMDLAALLDAPVTIAPRALVNIPTGLAIALPDAGWVALVFARSGLGIKHGIALSNGVGVIDSDYRGELRVGLTNLSDTPYTVQPGHPAGASCWSRWACGTSASSAPTRMRRRPPA